MLGALLGIVAQLRLQRGVLLGGGAAAARAGDGPHLDLGALQAHQRLRRGAGDDRLGELQVEHVRRRVDHPQRAIDVERIDPGARHLEALRTDDLEGVAGQDVLL